MPSPSPLFSPIKVANRWLSNRLVGLPVYTGYAHPGGWVSTFLTDHYTRLARSGVAMVVVANTAVSEKGILSAFNLRIDQDAYIDGLAKLAKAIQANGALACLQINHAGRFAKTEKPLIPAAFNQSHLAFNIASLKDFMNFFPLEMRFGLTRRFLKSVSHWKHPMTAADRERTITEFGLAASRAYQAGFDMIEIHGAGGYLLCQFLSSFTYKVWPDLDESLLDRSIFPLQVVREIKRNLPDQFPIGYRLILREWVPGGIDLGEAISFAKLLEREGVAYLSASAATFNSMLSPQIRKHMAQSVYLRADVAKLSKAVHIPTIAAGRILTPAMANDLIEKGVSQLVGLGRTLRVDSQWVTKARSGQKIIPCVNCNMCLKRVVLDKGYNCSRWPTRIQEQTELQIKLLSRNYKGLLVAANAKDVRLIQSALPHVLPDRRYINSIIAPTFLILKSQKKDTLFDQSTDDFIAEVRQNPVMSLFKDPIIHRVVVETKTPYDRAVNQQARDGGHGLIFLPLSNHDPWRRRVVFKEKGKIVVCIGSDVKWRRVLVPVDMSMNTLLTLMFFKQTFAHQVGISPEFVHILAGPSRPIEKRWSTIKALVQLDENLPLRLINMQSNVAADLVNLIRNEGFDIIVIGRRGVSMVKRWMLGSVSAALLQSFTDRVLILVD